MPIRVQVVGGKVAEFPDGTSPEVIQAALKKLSPAEWTSSLHHDPNPGTDDAGNPSGSLLDRIGTTLGKSTWMNQLAHPGTHGEGKLDTLGELSQFLLPSGEGVAGAIPDTFTGVGGKIRTGLKRIGDTLQGVDLTHPLQSPGKVLNWVASKLPEEKVATDGGFSPTSVKPATSGPAEAWRAEAAAKAKTTGTPVAVDAQGRPINPSRPPLNVRLAGKAPTVEDELLKALEATRTPESPEMVSGAPEPTTTEGGATRQSGKFGKSGNLGQAGGYTSGTPSLTQPAHDAVVASAMQEGADAAPAAQAAPVEAAPVLEDKLSPAPWDSSWAQEMPGESSPIVQKLLEGSRYLGGESGRSSAVGGPEAASLRAFFRQPGVLDAILEQMQGKVR